MTYGYNLFRLANRWGFIGPLLLRGFRAPWHGHSAAAVVRLCFLPMAQRQKGARVVPFFGPMTVILTGTE
jgi:hypothetical protein